MRAPGALWHHGIVALWHQDVPAGLSHLESGLQNRFALRAAAVTLLIQSLAVSQSKNASAAVMASSGSAHSMLQALHNTTRDTIRKAGRQGDTDGEVVVHCHLLINLDPTGALPRCSRLPALRNEAKITLASAAMLRVMEEPERGLGKSRRSAE